MLHRDIVVIGASAGGVETLSQLMRDLPADFSAAVFVVLHISPHSYSALPAILERAGNLPARHPKDGETIRPGTIYIAPPDHHLLLHEDQVRVVRGPRENGHRPAVDPLFRTAARYYGNRVIGVVLSGALDDGTAGLAAIKGRGGMALVQDPADAFHPGMPTNAIQNVAVDQVLPLRLMGAALQELVAQEIEAQAEPVTEQMRIETDMSELREDVMHLDERPGHPSGYTCPECHGCLFEIREGEFVRYRCRVGHAFSPDSLLAEQSQALDAALWVALRALEESSALARRLADRAQSRLQPISSSQFSSRADEAEKSAELIRHVLLSGHDLVRGGETAKADAPHGVDVGEEGAGNAG